jgi:formate hydrogenlyase subunit 3/multisubunit Na+/H+ antiporter MnhD subunit
MFLALMLVYLLLGRAFLGKIQRNRWFSVVAILSAVGFPPLTLGFQNYRVLKELHLSGLAPISVVFLICWYLIAIAAVQMITQILRSREDEVHPEEVAEPKFSHRADWVLFGVVVLCVIFITAYGDDILERLNTQSIPYLW